MKTLCPPDPWGSMKNARSGPVHLPLVTSSPRLLLLSGTLFVADINHTLCDFNACLLHQALGPSRAGLPSRALPQLSQGPGATNSSWPSRGLVPARPHPSLPSTSPEVWSHCPHFADEEIMLEKGRSHSWRVAGPGQCGKVITAWSAAGKCDLSSRDEQEVWTPQLLQRGPWSCLCAAWGGGIVQALPLAGMLGGPDLGPVLSSEDGL